MRILKLKCKNFNFGMDDDSDTKADARGSRKAPSELYSGKHKNYLYFNGHSLSV